MKRFYLTLLFAVMAAATATAELPETILESAGKNRNEIEKATAAASDSERPGLEFLLQNMPSRDLQSLSTEYLLENTRLAYESRTQDSWAKEVPEEIFLDAVLPYASINESRDTWRADFRKRFLPLVKDAKSCSEAAAILNQNIFKQLNVRYSTKRRRADQGPMESIESGLASCTGLSVLLIDACRSVGVPARFVGTPLWTNNSGNHSWVEIWDEGWHFTGAAEPTGNELDKGWFVNNASKAKRDERRYAIYATTFKKSPIHFPCVWAPRIKFLLRLVSELASKDLVSLASEEFMEKPISKAEVERARVLLKQHFLQSVRRERKAEMEAKQLEIDAKVMPFAFKTFGKKPADGWSLYISMHGGGGAPKRVNDRQWENQKRLYQLEEGIYLAPRAATDTWNLWHQSHIDGLFQRLIENMVAFEEVNPNRVYLMGYSAGGDGVFQLAPRMSDRWAAAAMMAGHPNETKPLGLRNVPFALQVGGRDAAYKRNEVAKKWAEKLKELQAQDPQGYEHFVKIYPEKGHWMGGEDKVAIPWMAKFARNPTPNKIVWKQDDVTHTHFYWLGVDKENAVAGSEVVAEVNGQTVSISATSVKNLRVYLDDRFIDLDKPVKIVSGEKQLFEGKVDRTAKTLAETLAARGDADLAFPAQVTVQLP